MARLKTYILFGNSNAGGYDSVNNLATSDWTRLTGNTTAPAALTKPVDVSVPGVYLWTPRLPYGSTTSLTASALCTGTTCQITTTTFINSPAADSSILKWVYVRSATSGQGQHRKITAFTTTQNVTVAAWTAPNDGATIELWNDSYTLSGATTTVLTIDNASGHSLGAVNSLVGKWVVVIDPASAVVLQTRKITANTGTTITVDTAFTQAPAAGEGIRVLTGANAVNAIGDTSATTGSFRDMRFYYDSATSLSTGYDYPNVQSFPHVGCTTYDSERHFGPLVELSWRLQHEAGGDIYIIHVSVSGAYMTRMLADSGLTRFSWFTPTDQNDWHPASTTIAATTPAPATVTTRDLYGYLIEQVLPAADAWVKANRSATDAIDVQGIFSINGEPDALEISRTEMMREATETIRDSMRSAINTAGFTTLAPHRIPFVMGLIHPNTVWTYYQTVNDYFEAMASDDLYTGVVDTSNYTMLVDTVHYNATSARTFGEDLYNKWKELRSRETSAALPDTERPTLSFLRDRVKKRYERSGISNQTALNTRIDEFINDSIREIYNHIGDNAWFLRRVESITANVNPTVTLLPSHMRRLYRLECPSNPGLRVTWSMLSYTSEGKLQALINYPGALNAHYRVIPKDLDTDEDVALLPYEHIELVVVLTCKRLAESAGNATLSTYYVGESQMLWRALKKDCAFYDRQRQESLTTIDSYDQWTSRSWPAMLE